MNDAAISDPTFLLGRKKVDTRFPGMTDSIVALSSGRLPAGIAVIRMSGEKVRFAIETFFGFIPPPRQATYGELHDPSGKSIDSGLLLFFPSPNSFTGEDCVEFHVHGGKAVVAKLLGALASLSGVRLAEAGEFTKRAFLNGKVDLPEAEALADLVAAETETQRRLAIQNASGAQSALYASWRQRLIHARAMIEAELDFADEADVPGSVADVVWTDITRLIEEIDDHIAGYHRAEMIRDGFDVVIVGAPNAGKSSLLNALSRRDAAIVSEEPGTTRDLVELTLDLEGVKVRLTDTAGIRDGAGTVEAIGIEKARQRCADADLVLLLVDCSDPQTKPPEVPGQNSLRIGSKADLARGPGNFVLSVSARTGEGIEKLTNLLTQRAVEAVGKIGDILPSRLRHIEHLRSARTHLEASFVERELELQAEELRLAGNQLGRVIGVMDTEELLDVIFAQFCIGK